MSSLYAAIRSACQTRFVVAFPMQESRPHHGAHRSPASFVTDLRLVVVAARELDERACLPANGPGIMAGRKQHHVSGGKVLPRAVGHHDTERTRCDKSNMRQFAQICAGVLLIN